MQGSQIKKNNVPKKNYLTKEIEPEALKIKNVTAQKENPKMQ
jgi:hypothetical protein